MPVPASLPEHRMSSSTGRLERREEAAALPARSGLHLEGRTNCPEHPARLCLAVAVPSSSSCCPQPPSAARAAPPVPVPVPIILP